MMFRYCWLCLAHWKKSKGDLVTCPECREPVKSETRVLDIEPMIEELTDKKEREEKIAERKGRRTWLIIFCSSV